MMASTIALFCCLDDFAKPVEEWERRQLLPSDRQRRPARQYPQGKKV